MKKLAFVLAVALLLAAQTPTPTPPCCRCCDTTPTPTPTPPPGSTPTPTPTVTPTTTVTPTPPPAAQGTCSLLGAPTSFEPRPPGAVRPITLSPGFNNKLELYQNGAGGPNRILMMESFGDSILDITNPLAPAALYYHDVRFPVGGNNSIPQHGDGQNMIQTLAVSPDGQRAAFSITGPGAPFQTVVANSNGFAFTLWGDFPQGRAFGTLLQHVGSRYIAYSINGDPMTVADVTVLPSDSLQVNNLVYEVSTLPAGTNAQLAGNYILYIGEAGLWVINAASPGPPGSITANYPRTAITTADLGGRMLAAYTAAVDPSDATKVWVLVELNPLAGENSPSYTLLYVHGLVKTTVGPVWRVPALSTELWGSAGISSALIPSGGNVYALMWASRRSPSALFKLYSTTIAAWSGINTAAPPGVFSIPTTLYGNFWTQQPMRGFSVGSNVYAYLPTGQSAYMLPMVCK